MICKISQFSLITGLQANSASPLPAGGQAPALLEHRKEESLKRIGDFKRSFGCEKNCQPLSEQEFEQRRASVIKALLATEKDRQKTADI